MFGFGCFKEIETQHLLENRRSCPIINKFINFYGSAILKITEYKAQKWSSKVYILFPRKSKFENCMIRTKLKF